MKIKKTVNFLVMACVVLLSVMMTGCDDDPSTTDVVVSDGITDNDLASGRPEILPNVTVYKIPDKGSDSFAKFLLAENCEGLGVVFCVRRFGDTDWIRLGSDILYTDKDGRATLPSLRDRLPQSILDEAPIDVQLQARIYFNASTYISDDKGLVRILSGDKNDNPEVVFTDHDNTVHATGGKNSVEDWVDFLNWAKNEWPYVDDTVVDAFSELGNEGRDIVIVSGLLNDIRFKCREQMNRHFESSSRRFIPIVIKDDMAFEHSNEFKKGALQVLRDLYGSRNCLAMVGDTVREDGFGAISNSIMYVPFQIHYDLAPGLLDTEGYGSVDPDSITNNWAEVLDVIDNGPVVEDNFFLRRYRPALNIAHRGGGALLPENTIEAYRYSYAVGADSIEGDVHMTSDGFIVVSHDDTVDRCTNGSGKIMDKTLAEIKALDAGYTFTTDGGNTFPCRGLGYRIPTLEEVFSDPVLNKRPMVLEIKQSGQEIVEKVLDLIKAWAMEDNLIIGAFDQATLDLISDLALLEGMNLVRIFSTEGVLEFVFTPRWILESDTYESPGDILCLPKEMMTTLTMDKARYLGYKVYVWTVNSGSAMDYQINTIHADGIMSDNPLLLENRLTD
jgi:glycerophosphoryl diester phosphodiesterase